MARRAQGPSRHLLNHLGRGRFKAYSAGSFPVGEVNPLALDVLRRNSLRTEGLGSKNWSEFSGLVEVLDTFSLQRELDRIGAFDVTPAE